MEFKDLDLMSMGNSSLLAGVIYTGKENVIVWLPGEYISTPLKELTSMTNEDWKVFIKQTDDVNVEVKIGPEKAIMRKSLRAIDQNISWAVYKRDGFLCRYCNSTGIPLTVDHVDLWENGGATVAENLLTACKKCNKNRGNMEYGDWLQSSQYLVASKGLDQAELDANSQVLQTLPHLITLRVSMVRSR